MQIFKKEQFPGVAGCFYGLDQFIKDSGFTGLDDPVLDPKEFLELRRRYNEFFQQARNKLMAEEKNNFFYFEVLPVIFIITFILIGFADKGFLENFSRIYFIFGFGVTLSWGGEIKKYQDYIKKPFFERVERNIPGIMKKQVEIELRIWERKEFDEKFARNYKFRESIKLKYEEGNAREWHLMFHELTLQLERSRRSPVDPSCKSPPIHEKMFEVQSLGNVRPYLEQMSHTDLCKWAKRQRKMYNQKLLTQEYIDKLESINGWYWD